MQLDSKWFSPRNLQLNLCLLLQSIFDERSTNIGTSEVEHESTDKYIQPEQGLFHRQLRILLLQQFPTKIHWLAKIIIINPWELK